MHQDFLHAESSFRICAEKASDQVLSLLANILLHVVARLQDLLVQVFHVVCLEGHCAEKKSEQDYACTPQIGFKAFVPLVFDNFWGNVSRSARLLEHDFSALNSFWDSKICNFHITLAIKKDVVKLDISMQDRLWVDVADSFDDLLEKNFGERLVTLFTLAHEV